MNKVFTTFKFVYSYPELLSYKQDAYKYEQLNDEYSFKNIRSGGTYKDASIDKELEQLQQELTEKIYKFLINNNTYIVTFDDGENQLLIGKSDNEINELIEQYKNSIYMDTDRFDGYGISSIDLFKTWVEDHDYINIGKNVNRIKEGVKMNEENKKISLEEATLKALATQAEELEDGPEQAEGIMDGIIVVTDPEVDTKNYEEIIEKAQEIVDNTPEGEIPFDEEYLGEYMLTCPICGTTFIEPEILEPGATCPVCLDQPESFIVVGKVEADSDINDDMDDVTDDIEALPNLNNSDDIESAETEQQELETVSDEEDASLEKDVASKQLMGDNKLTEQKLEEDDNSEDNKITIPGLENYENIANKFEYYNAYKANFGPLVIVKANKIYYIFKENAKDYNSYIDYATSKDYIEGWLHGAVKAKNKILENKLTEDLEDTSDPTEVDRVKNLKLMDIAARHLNDEDLIDMWLSYGVPDGANDEDYQDIADDKESYIDIENTFKKLMDAAKVDGLFDCPKDAFEFAKQYEPELKNTRVERDENDNIDLVTEAKEDRVKELLDIVDDSFDVIGESVNLEEGDKLEEAIRLTSIPGVVRTPENDFSDDGNKFYSYLYKGVIPISYHKAQGDIYLTIRLDSIPEINYNEYNKFKTYNLTDEFNGVDESEYDASKFAQNLEAVYQEVMQFKKDIKPVDSQQVEDKIQAINKACQEYKKKVEDFIKAHSNEILNLSEYQFKDLKRYVADAGSRTADYIRDASEAGKRSFLDRDIDSLIENISSSWEFKYIEEMFTDNKKDSKTESYNVDGFPNNEKLQKYFQDLGKLPDEIELDGKTYFIEQYGGKGANSWVIYTDKENDDSYIRIYYTLHQTGEDSYEGIEEITGVSDLRESKVIKTEVKKGDVLTVEYRDKDGNEKTTHFQCNKNYDIDGEQIKIAIKSMDNDIDEIIKLTENNQIDNTVQEKYNPSVFDNIEEELKYLYARLDEKENRMAMKYIEVGGIKDTATLDKEIENALSKDDGYQRIIARIQQIEDQQK